MIARKNYFKVLAYLDYQEKVFQNSPKSIRRKWAHLRHLLEWADEVLFQEANDIDPGFPKYLLTARNDNKGKQLSPISMRKACGEARRLFQWGKISEPVEYKPITPLWIESIRPAKSRGLHSELVDRKYYTLEEVQELIEFKPIRFVDKRDRAAVAMLFLSGMRLGAFVTLPIYCVDLDKMVINQLPSEGVETKNGKAAKTYLLPIASLLKVMKEWDNNIRSDLGENALWYPNLTSDGMDWKYGPTGSTDSRQAAFSRGLKRFCGRVGVEYKSAHKLRNGHGVYGVKNTKTIEEFKAFSQNMMHSSMEITDSLYGRLASDDVRNVILKMGGKNGGSGDEDMFKLFSAFKTWLENQK